MPFTSCSSYIAIRITAETPAAANVRYGSNAA
jgi:hypothetical protein